MKIIKIAIPLLCVVVLFFGLFVKTGFLLFVELSSARNKILAAFLGVPVVAISIGSALIGAIRYLVKKL